VSGILILGAWITQAHYQFNLILHAGAFY